MLQFYSNLDFDFEQSCGSGAPGTKSRNFLLMSRSNCGQKLIHSFRRNLHTCNWFRTDESKKENCCHGKLEKGEGRGKIIIKTKIKDNGQDIELIL